MRRGRQRPGAADLTSHASEPIHGPTVSVVITSVDRPSVREAVVGALAQSYPPIEVIVVFDRDDDTAPIQLPVDPRVTVAHTGGRRGAAAGRQLGVSLARGDLVAFLDDDDVWRVDKLHRQVQEYQRLRPGGQHVLVSCRADMRLPDGRSRGVAPTRPYHQGMDVADYLFIRRSVLQGGFGLASSTLLCDASLLREVPWNANLRLHEDWDWVIRATRAGALLAIVPEPLVVYRLQPPGHAASRPPGGWDRSAEWARSRAMSATALGDFLLCVSGVNAAAYGRRKAAVLLAAAALREGRPTWRAWAAFGLQLLLPPRIAGSAAMFVSRVREPATRMLSRTRSLIVGSVGPRSRDVQDVGEEDRRLKGHDSG